MKTLFRALPVALALVSGLAFAGPSKKSNEALELPLLLQAERAKLLSRVPFVHRSGSPHFNSELFLYHITSHGWYRPGGKVTGGGLEPFGVHIDANPFNGPEPLRVLQQLEDDHEGTRGKAGTCTIFHSALALALVSRKHVLLSARVEPLVIHYPAGTGQRWTVADLIRVLLESHGVRAAPLGDDTYVMLEATSVEGPFPYGLGRAVQYEKEREAWLLAHPYYSPQGLIYQPTDERVKEAWEISDQDGQVRHAAALLAKLAGKEVFVTAGVEKRDFRFPHLESDDSPETVRDEILRQLGRARVKRVELDANSFALLPE